MTPRELRDWRFRMNWTQVEACAALGVKIRAYQNWESFDECARRTTFPVMLRLACNSLEAHHRGDGAMRISLRTRRVPNGRVQFQERVRTGGGNGRETPDHTAGREAAAC